MRGKVSKKGKLFLWLWVLVGLMADWGCHLQKPGIVYTPLQTRINKLVVVGFHSAISMGEQPDVVRCPLSGSIFMAEPVPHNVVQRMTDVLYEKVAAEKGYESISPARATEVFSGIVGSDKGLRVSPIEILQEVGSTFEADGVLAGYIYRWREREGTDYAVNRPASVAFDLHLINPAGGAILWKSKFDKTQQSLSENIFDLKTFFESRGRWMTVEKLAMFGLRKMLAELPAGKASGMPSQQIEREGP
ncbi:MAG: hypothetical protein JSV50_11610 [Desulfobacteraceae bacterium]|nr:MAG: hypothetical protein JSV50_11610 [Desulfobacteraceae bacterium]